MLRLFTASPELRTVRKFFDNKKERGRRWPRKPECSREGEHVTVNEIHDHFREIGSSMGVATIYRQLEKLVAEGQMRKYVVDSGSAACFEYIGARQGHARFIHCKCEKCGKVLHVERSEIEEMARLLEERSGFRMDNVQTVLYGVCGECREENG